MCFCRRERRCRPVEVSDSGVVRLTFDPEALPEHPSAQLASFGTPLVDQLLNDALAAAAERGNLL